MSDQALLDEGTTTSQATTETGSPEYTPAFWRSDYKRFAADLRQARMERGGYSLKGGTAQDTIDAAAAALAEVFAADSEAAGRQPGDKYYFDAEKFAAGTKPHGFDSTSQDDEDDEDDED